MIRFNSQQGAALLVSSTLMLVLVGSVTLHTARVKYLTYRGQMNAAAMLQARATANAGLVQGIARLNQQAEWETKGLRQNLANGGHFELAVEQQVLIPNLTSIAVIQSTGYAGEHGRLRVKQQALVYPLLAKIPQTGIHSSIFQVKSGVGHDSILEYFAIPSQEMGRLRDAADLEFTDCDDLDSNSVGTIWVVGNCHLGPAQVLGSVSSPLVIFVIDGSFSMAGQSQINGLLVVYSSAENLFTPTLNMHASARIRGAVLVQHTQKVDVSALQVTYKPAVLQSIRQLPVFKQVALIPGTWQDF